MPSVTCHYVLLRMFHPCSIFDFFQNLGADGIGLAYTIRLDTDINGKDTNCYGYDG